MISYAQNREDVLLNRVFGGSRVGFYVDAGANDPIFHSVTKHFSDLGWTGISIEPQPELAERLATDRPRDVTLNVGLSDRSGMFRFYEAPTIHGWSTFCDDLAARYRREGLDLVER